MHFYYYDFLLIYSIPYMWENVFWLPISDPEHEQCGPAIDCLSVTQLHRHEPPPPQTPPPSPTHTPVRTLESRRQELEIVASAPYPPVWCLDV